MNYHELLTIFLVYVLPGTIIAVLIALEILERIFKIKKGPIFKGGTPWRDSPDPVNPYTGRPWTFSSTSNIGDDLNPAKWHPAKPPKDPFADK